MKAWKACERKMAEVLRGVRLPVSGRQRGTTPDVEHSLLSIRKTPSAWLLDALEQARAASENGGLPVTVLHQDRKQYGDCLCVLRLEHLSRLLDKKVKGSEA